MKKTLLRIAIFIAICTIVGFNAMAQTTVLSENFSGLTVSAGSTDISTTLNTKLQTTGWTGSKIYENAGNAKIGSSSALGYITTKAINISANSGVATLKIDIMKYGTDAGVVRVYHAANGTTFTQVGTDITPTAAFSTITINITGGTATSKIKISGTSASSGRFYLDNVLVIQTAVTVLAPTVTTTSVSGILNTSAVSGGNVTADGGASVTARGVCWSTTANPTTANSKTSDGTGTGAFTSSLTGLTAGILYYVRAYATNSVGTSYGSQVSFTTTNTTSNSTASDIIANASFTYSSNIAYASYTGSDVTSASPELFSFTIRDGGATVDADALSTTLSAISFNLGYYINLNKIALYDGTTELAEVASASTTTFSGLSVAALDNSSKTLSIRATFATTVTDNLQILFTVSSATASTAGSTFATSNAGGASSSVTGDYNRIEVVASSLAFTTQPSTTATVSVALAQQPVVAARDANGNRDFDYTSTVTLSNSGALTMSSNTATTVSGIALFSGFSINQTGAGITLTASSNSFTSTASSAITIGSASNTGTVTVSLTTLTNFGKVYAANLSEAQFFTVSGTGLSGNITVTAPTGFVVSKLFKTGYASSVTLTQSGGTLTSTKIFARYSPTVVGTNSGSISITGASAAKTVTVSGTCVASYIPSGYYSTATGTGATLKTQLYNKIKTHTTRTYDNLWTDFKTTDDNLNGKVWDMYSNVPDGTPSYQFTFVTNQCGTYAAEGGCYNREHSFPKSWWGGSTATQYTDLFHLVPTDGYVNNMRSNYAFGTVASPTYTSSNGSKLGPCSFPGYTGTVFEPIDEYKGDFARAYFYMATCYENLFAGWQNYDANGNAMMNGTAFPGFETWAVNLLRTWHINDPISQKEIERNQTVYGIQGNRNPYIDHPEYVTMIWGSGAKYSETTGIANYDNSVNYFIFPNPAQDVLNIQWTENQKVVIEIYNLSGRLVTKESVDGSSSTINIANLPSGIYLINIFDGKKITGKKFMKN